MLWQAPGRSQRPASSSCYAGCSIGVGALLVPYAKARFHAKDEQFGHLILCFGAGSILSTSTVVAMSGLLWLNTYVCRGRFVVVEVLSKSALWSVSTAMFAAMRQTCLLLV